MADYLEAFLARLSGRTRENYCYDLDLWQRWLTKRHTDLLDATRQDIEEWVAERRESGQIGARTACVNLSRLAGFYRWAHETGLIAHNPTILIRRPRYGRTERPWLGREDLTRLLKASLDWKDGELSAHVHLWALSGLRPGEPRGLLVSDLSTHDGRCALRVTATKTPSIERLVLPDSTATLLRAAAGGRKRGPLLIHPRTGRAWTKANERQRFAQLLADAKLPAVTPYGLRVSFITLALASGIPERDVAIGARHASSAQTARYDRLRTHVDHPVGPRLEAWLHSSHDLTKVSA